jgi:hypothetical protein
MAVPQTVPVRRLSFEDALAMVEAGILRETDRAELEGGELVEMEPSGGSHGSRVHREPRSSGFGAALAYGRGERIAAPVPAARVHVAALQRGA